MMPSCQIKTMFKRDKKTGKLIDKLLTSCSWVLDDDVVCHISLDGIEAKVYAWTFYRRSSLSGGSGRWVRSDLDLLKCFLYESQNIPDGFYILVGNHILGNPYDVEFNYLIPPDSFKVVIPKKDRNLSGIESFLYHNYVHGLVFSNNSGEKAKITRQDLGIDWGTGGFDHDTLFKEVVKSYGQPSS